MRIEALRLQENTAERSLEWKVAPGLNAVCGPPQPAKSQLVEFLAQVLFGRPSEWSSPTDCRPIPEGEVVVQRGCRRYRLRRYHDSTSTSRLTVAGLDGSPVDSSTVHDLVGRLPPTVLAPVCAVSFREVPEVARLLSREMARGYQGFGRNSAINGGRRLAELSARRDLLAQELETRIAGERRVSKELDARWRELDRLVREEQQQASSHEQRLRAVEAALAETDARLRYRRLELNVQLRWNAEEGEDFEPKLAELDDQIARWRTTLADLGRREAGVRARLAENQVSCGATTGAVVDQHAWLAVARQLAADLAGEVARLARATASQQCVCHDAHPRLRPIAETIERQLDVLESLIDEQQGALVAVELQKEVETLAAAQAELGRYLENLLERRQMLARGVRPSRRPGAPGAHASGSQAAEADDPASFSAADAEQLEERRTELAQERFQLAEQLSAHHRSLRDLRAQRDTVERQRAALLSARSIEHVQRELADVQRKLEQAAECVEPQEDEAISPENIVRSSDFLAQLTNGELVRLVLVDFGRRARVVNRTGDTMAVESLAAMQRDLVYLSLCLGFLSALAQRGVWLPLVLDEVFTRLDARSTAALAAVLDDFCRRGHQVLVFASQPAAIERLTSIGAVVQDIAELQQAAPQEFPTRPEAPSREESATRRKVAKRTTGQRPISGGKRKNASQQKKLNGRASDRSDAA